MSWIDQRACPLLALFAALATSPSSRAQDGAVLATGFAPFDLGGSNSDNGWGVEADHAGRFVVAVTSFGTDNRRIGNVARFLPNGALPDDTQRMLVARLTSTGVLDTTFGLGDGMQELPLNLLVGFEHPTLDSIAVLPDGHMLGAGETWDNQVTGDSLWIAIRLSEGGFPDASFAGTGFVAGDLSCPGALACGNPAPRSRALTLAQQGDGLAIVAGEEIDPVNGEYDIALARLLADGTLDFTFGDGGQVFVDLPWGIGAGHDTAVRSTLLPDGRLVVSGVAEWNWPDRNVAFFRLENSYLSADGFEWGDSSKWSSTLA